MRAPFKPSIWGPAQQAALGFLEDKENSRGGAGFNPQDGAHGSAVALVL